MANLVQDEKIIVEEVVRILTTDGLKQDWLSGDHRSECFGKLGALSPLTKSAFIDGYGKEATERYEQLAKDVIKSQREAFKQTKYYQYKQQAAAHQGLPKEGDFVWCNTSNFKQDGGNGVYGELRDMIVYSKGDNEKYLCKVAKVFEVSDEDFLRGALADELVEQSQFVGGCQSDDIEQGATEMTPVQKDTWFTLCAAIVNNENGKWFLMDPEGYEYARYIFLPLNWLDMYEKEVKHIMAQEDLEKNYDYHLPNCYK